MVFSFSAGGAADLQSQTLGGKGRTLAWLYQSGYPVPDGFVITPEAFVGDELSEAGWTAVSRHLDQLRQNGTRLFAVRSSAVSEDSAQASFAGEFETVLNMRSDDEIRQAIQAIRQSRHSKRVQAYSEAVNSPQRRGERGETTAEISVPSAPPRLNHEIAVVVQEMVPAELAGVLFTADPVSGSHSHMPGNFVRGLGEKLVSGEETGEAFRLARPDGKVEGAKVMERYGRTLFKLAQQLVAELDGPQDIEWAVADGKVYLLQARPITTLHGRNPATGEWNDSLRGDYSWTNANFGEAFPDVMTPLTWSIIQMYAQETIPPFLPSHLPVMGNIAGRFYMNISLMASLFQVLGFSRERMNRESEEFFGHLPENMTIAIYPFPRWKMRWQVVSRLFNIQWTRRQHIKQLDDFTRTLPHHSAKLVAGIRASSDPLQLAQLWQEQLEPLLRRTFRMLQVGTSRYENAYRPLQRQLRRQIGPDKAITLLSAVSDDGDRLSSLGPLVGLWQVKTGELSREAYLQRYGHRSPHEMEISIPRPAESAGWLDEQLAALEDVDVPALLARQEAKKEQVWQNYANRFPRQARKMKQKLAKAARLARVREAIRSEMTRLVSVGRDFALRAGELTGLGNGAFFLSAEEMVAVLRGETDTAVPHIPARRQTHEAYRSLPPYPTIINGRFNPFQWAQDPNRRSDIFDAHQDAADSRTTSGQHIVTGYPGSPGIVEGIVRRLDNMDEANQFRPGEILVTNTTNVGWTPLFPRAAAVVTDVGAPLSHAAIVARELGIPAVVGCNNATMHLQSGSRVRVNGGQGTVELLDAAGYE